MTRTPLQGRVPEIGALRYPLGAAAICLIAAASLVGVLGAAAVLVAVIVVGVTAWRTLPALAAVRRVRRGAGEIVSVRRVRVQHRMRSRGFLEVTESDGRITWWPIVFHPDVLALVPGAVARRATWGGAGAFLAGPDLLLLPAGRPRGRPRGTLVDAPRLNDEDLRTRSARFGSPRRRILLDTPAAVGAPVVGLLWVLVGGGGIVAFVAATALAAVVAVWASAISGSDPS
ncbi:MAG: hypothetical protein PGN29_10275 [Gordonia paraffinivorans]